MNLHTSIFTVLVSIFFSTGGCHNNSSLMEKDCQPFLTKPEIHKLATDFLVKNGKSRGFNNVTLKSENSEIVEVSIIEDLILYNYYTVSTFPFSILYSSKPVCKQQVFWMSRENLRFEFLQSDLKGIKQFIDTLGVERITLASVNQILFEILNLSEDSLLITQKSKGILTGLRNSPYTFPENILQSDLSRINSLIDSIKQTPDYPSEPEILTNGFAYLLYIFKPSNPQRKYIFILYQPPLAIQENDYISYPIEIF